LPNMALLSRPSKMGSPGAIFRTVLGNFMLRSRQRLRIAASKF